MFSLGVSIHFNCAGLDCAANYVLRSLRDLTTLIFILVYDSHPDLVQIPAELCHFHSAHAKTQ